MLQQSTYFSSILLPNIISLQLPLSLPHSIFFPDYPLLIILTTLIVVQQIYRSKIPPESLKIHPNISSHKVPTHLNSFSIFETSICKKNLLPYSNVSQGTEYTLLRIFLLVFKLCPPGKLQLKSVIRIALNFVQKCVFLRIYLKISQNNDITLYISP